MRWAAATCCLWSAPANVGPFAQCHASLDGEGAVPLQRLVFPSFPDWLLGVLAADQCIKSWTPMCCPGICAAYAAPPCIDDNSPPREKQM